MTWVQIDQEAGSFDNIIMAHSLNGDAMRAHLGLYRAIMMGDSGLSRGEREAVAVAVSTSNSCEY